MATASIYDSVNEGATTGIPRSAQIIAFYADGKFANETAARATFPLVKTFLSITVFGLVGCRIGDCENGDMTAKEAAWWAHLSIIAGICPTIYCNLSMHPSVVAELALLGLFFIRDVDWWAADYVDFPYLVPGSVATQWGGNMTGDFDISDTNGIWPGTAVAPIPAGGSVTALINGIAWDVTPSGNGYWEIQEDGAVFTHGDANFFGGLNTVTHTHPVVDLVAHPTSGGYWIATSDGGVFTCGPVNFFGSTGNITLDAPIVRMHVSKSGNGYALEASDGGIFTFGDFPFVGSGQ